MQRRLLFLTFSAGAFGVKTTAELRADSWLEQHAAPNTDELAELRGENPDAYAIVKALLTKRSLGLLDPKHPTASFAAPAHEDSQDHAVGAAVYAKFATTAKEQAALASSSVEEPFPSASQQSENIPFPQAAPEHKDWLSWKPHNTADDDEAMVKSVLGAVADLKGKSLRGSANVDTASPFQAEVAQEEVEAPRPVKDELIVTTTTVLVSDMVAGVSENSYLKGLDLTEAPSVSTTQQIFEKRALPENNEKSVLDSFSFDDAAAAPTTTTTSMMMQKSNPLASWLGFAKPHVQAAATNAAATPSNPYLVDLQ